MPPPQTSQPPPAPDLDVARRHRLHASAAALLYDVAKRVRSGYHWHVAGEVPAEKVLGLVAKFSEAHGTHENRLTRHRRKASGETAATLFVWAVRNDPAGYTTRFRFLLLATKPLEGERLLDGRHKPVRVSLYPGDAGEFHLVATKRPWKRGESRKGPPPQVFIWRLAPRAEQLLRDRLTAAAGGEAHDLLSLVRAYYAFPMPAPVRVQFKTALNLVRPIWKANQTPSVKQARERFKRGDARDPFTTPPPWIGGFPKMFTDPPETLADHLAAAAQVRGQVKRQRTLAQKAMHAEPLPAALLGEMDPAPTINTEEMP